jgi:hypothetical protein
MNAEFIWRNFMHITDKRTREIIKKWYYALSFDKKYDEEFLKALDAVYVDCGAVAEDYKIDDADGKKNFLYYLYFCEEMQRAYLEKGIPHDMFMDNAYDIVIWTDIWSNLKGELFLGEIDWLWHIFTLRIIKVGRLQYFRRGAKEDAPTKNLKAGDPVLDIHIPARGPLYRDECVKSLELAKEFFGKYYPEFDYKCFTCHSWLLDLNLNKFLSCDTNIIKFQNLFTHAAGTPLDSAITFCFPFGVTRENIKDFTPKTSLQSKIRNFVIDGGVLYYSFGVRAKDKDV